MVRDVSHISGWICLGNIGGGQNGNAPKTRRYIPIASVAAPEPEQYPFSELRSLGLGNRRIPSNTFTLKGETSVSPYSTHESPMLVTLMHEAVAKFMEGKFPPETFNRPIKIHCCKDRTLSYRSEDEPIFNGVAIQVFSVNSEIEAEVLINLVGITQYEQHPLLP